MRALPDINGEAFVCMGRTVHERQVPFKRSFSHRIAMIDVDIDQLELATRGHRFFSLNKFNALSIRTSDYGSRKSDASLRDWAEGQFRTAQIELDGGQIRLLAFPRTLGYGFSPIAVWLGHGPKGELRGVIYEVHNTFGEAHAYVYAWTGHEEHHASTKDFHVSPFFDVSGEYRFMLRNHSERIELIVENFKDGERTHVASLLARRKPMSDGAILKWLFTMPLSGLGVMFAIHWQALIIWMRGARYHRRPEQRVSTTTIATSDTTQEVAQETLRRRA